MTTTKKETTAEDLLIINDADDFKITFDDDIAVSDKIETADSEFEVSVDFADVDTKMEVETEVEEELSISFGDDLKVEDAKKEEVKTEVQEQESGDLFDFSFSETTPAIENTQTNDVFSDEASDFSRESVLDTAIKQFMRRIEQIDSLKTTKGDKITDFEEQVKDLNKKIKDLKDEVKGLESEASKIKLDIQKFEDMKK